MIASHRTKKLLLAAAVANVALVAAPSARAETWALSGGGTWNDGANWTPMTVPNAVGATAIFDTPGATRSVTLDTTITAGTLSFTNNGSFVQTIANGTTGGPLTLDNGGAGVTFNFNSTGGAVGNNTLVATQVLNDTLTANVNYHPTAGNPATQGAFNWTGLVTGTGGFIKAGDGLVTLGTNAKSYTGATLLNNGRMRFTTTGAPTQSASFTINTGGQLSIISTGSYQLGQGSFTLNGSGPTTGNFAQFPGAFRPDSNITVNILNPVVLGSDSLVHVRQTGASTGKTTFASTVSGPGALIYTDPQTDANAGSLVLASANTYSGGTVVNGGTLDATAGTLGATTGPLTVQCNVQAGFPIATLVLLNTSNPTTTGSLNSQVFNNAGSTATINNGGQLFTVNQTTPGSYYGAITGAGGFALGPLSTNTLTLTTATGPLSYTGNTTVAAGRLVLATNLTKSSAVNVSGGSLDLAAGGGSLRVINTPAVAVTGTGRLDIEDNKLITQTPVGTASGGVYSDITGMIQKGRNGGGWGGSGIVTSQSNATSGNFTSIGVATAQQVKGLATPADTTVFAGQTVTGSDTLVMYTYGGDANLDGKINVDDYGHIDSSIPIGLSGWFNGDFNYDGKINVDDYGIIDFNIGIQGAQFPTAGGSGGSLGAVSAVPEPASVGVLAVGAAAAVIRRRRRAR